MNKEEILAISRKENKNKDIADLEAEKKARSYAGAITLIFAGILFFADALINRGCNFSLIAVIMFYNMVVGFVKLFTTKNKINLIIAISSAFPAIYFTSIAIIEFTK